MCGRKSNNNLCMVCESPKAISQFGAMTCRACGAFFRRLLASKRQYDCDCDVRLRGKVESETARKQRISNCRGCRQRRCIRAGMREETTRKCKNNLSLVSVVKKEICIPNSEDVLGFVFIQKLLEIEEKANHILLNVFGFGNSFLDRFSTFEQLIQSKDNLLDHADYYKSRKIEYFDKAAFEENLAKHGLFSEEPISFTKQLLLSIDIAKTLPAFSRLELKDQMASVSGFALASSFIIGRFNSMKVNAETDVMEIIHYPLVQLFTKYIVSNEPVIKHLAEALFDLPMKDFIQIAPSREEFVLILTLLYTSSAIPKLSKFGQQIMNEETEKCAKIMLRYQQLKYGEQGGALRYLECFQLLWNTISSVQKNRELIAYIDTIYEQGGFEKKMPKILTPLVI